MKKYHIWLSIALTLLFLSTILVIARMDEMKLLSSKTTVTYEMTDKAVHNPLMGFAPDAALLEEERDNSLVYVAVTFRELWPEKGKIDFESIEIKNKMQQWRKEGKHVVLRFIADYPTTTEHMDIPDWLFAETGDGEFYDNAYGKGYSPNYNNPLFIQYHAQAIEALGDRYGDDTFISYIQLGSLGHWGEWHTHSERGVSPMPLADIRRQYVLPYVQAFPKVKLLMRRPFAIAQEFQMGVYNDMAGHLQLTREWLGWMENGGEYDQTGEEDELVPMNQAWKKAPIGGEFTSAIPMVNMLVTNLEQTLQMLGDSHTSFLGPKVPANQLNTSYAEGAEAVLRKLGYRIGVTKTVWAEPYLGGADQVKLTFENNGVAPMYWDWPVYLYGYNSQNELLYKLPVELKLTDLLPGKKIQTVNELADHPDVAFLYIGIEDPMTGQPAIQLISDQEVWGNLFLIHEW